MLLLSSCSCSSLPTGVTLRLSAGQKVFDSRATRCVTASQWFKVSFRPINAAALTEAVIGAKVATAPAADDGTFGGLAEQRARAAESHSQGFPPFRSLMDLPGRTAETVWSLLLYSERITTAEVLNWEKTRYCWGIWKPPAPLSANKVRWWLNLAIQNFFSSPPPNATRQSLQSAVNWNTNGAYKESDFYPPLLLRRVFLGHLKV